MAQAQRKTKFSEFANEYNLIIPQAIDALEHFAALAEKAFNYFNATNSKDALYTGFVAATCWVDMGKLDDAEVFFNRYLPFISFNPDLPESVSIYLQYARLLSFKGEHEAAVNLTELLFMPLAVSGEISTLLTAIYICGSAKRYDELWKGVELTDKVHPGLAASLFHPIMLPYLLEQDEQELVLKFAAKYAHLAGDQSVNLDNVSSVFYAIGFSLIHQGLHPEISEEETRYLSDAWNVVLDILLAGNEREVALRKILAFEKDFLNLGFISRKLFYSKTLDQNIEQLGFVLDLCRDFQELLAVEGVKAQFTLDLDDDPEWPTISLLIQPDREQVSVYAAQASIVKKYAQAIARLEPGLLISADYSRANAESQAVAG